jgi:hypothetical protein
MTRAAGKSTNWPFDRTRLAAVCLVLVSLISSCAPKPLRVGLVFENSWTIGREALTEPENTLVKKTALQALRSAFSGFNVQFSEEISGGRLIRAEDTPYRSYGPGSIVSPGAVGMTYPIATVSIVYPDALYAAELAAARCQNLIRCDAKTREQLLEGLGRGIGATAAHELGHQAGLHFSRDSRCDDCYDSHLANTYAHFFSTLYWSDDALAIMKRVLRARTSTQARLLKISLLPNGSRMVSSLVPHGVSCGAPGLAYLYCFPDSCS